MGTKSLSSVTVGALPPTPSGYHSRYEMISVTDKMVKLIGEEENYKYSF